MKNTFLIHELVHEYISKKSLLKKNKSGTAIAYGSGYLNIFINCIEKFETCDTKDLIKIKCIYFTEIVRYLINKNNINENVQIRFYMDFIHIKSNHSFIPTPLFITETNKPKRGDYLINFKTGEGFRFQDNYNDLLDFDEGYFINEVFHREISSITSYLRHDFWNNINI